MREAWIPITGNSLPRNDALQGAGTGGFVNMNSGSYNLGGNGKS